jgi:long-chain acyl-CoA synthetase
VEPAEDLARTAARLARQVDKGLAEVGLSASQFRILGFLADGSAVASALADRGAISRPSLTAVVDGLVARGLVERREDPADRRRVAHLLTPAGRDALAAGEAAVNARLANILDLLGDDELSAQAVRGLQLWQAALDLYRETLHAAASSGGRAEGARR